MMIQAYLPGGVRVAEVRHLEDHLLHVVRVGAHLELADLKEGRRKEGRSVGRWVHSSITALSKGMRAIAVPSNNVRPSVSERADHTNQPFELQIVEGTQQGGHFDIMATRRALEVLMCIRR